MRYASIILLGIICLSISPTRLLTRTPDPPRISVHAESGRSIFPQASLLPDTVVLARYDFEDGLGGPDTQGWVSEDLTYQETYIHVDDFSAAGAPYAALEGSQSLWCGQEILPNCVSCPGYGNTWRQHFESVTFPSSGDVTLSYLIEYDMEPGYDYAYVQYLSKSDIWQTLDSYNGAGMELGSVIVPSDSLDSGVKLRFNFISDGAFSDEDGMWPTNGAFIIDSLTVSDTLGVLDFQNFETEVQGALSTADGDWTASGYPAFGDFAALFDGSSVLQEDTLVTNNTFLWGFFNGSTYTYDCGGHPEQPAVPFTSVPGSRFQVDYINNEIWSPLIDLSQDENGIPITSELGAIVLEFDVYRDMPLNNLLFYTYSVRYLFEGKMTPWTTSPMYHSPTNNGDWFRASGDFTSSYVQGASHIQIAIGVEDRCDFWCGSLGDGSCHSQAPLIDNVLLLRSDVDPIMVTNTNDDGPGSLRQAIIESTDQDSNDPDRDAIHFNIPGPGPHVIAVLTEFPASIRTVVIDGTTQPGYSGTPLVVIDGGGPIAGLRGLEINGNSSTIRGLEIRNFFQAGLRIVGTDYTIVESNYIHHNTGVGILISGSRDNNIIGGSTPDFGNTITDNTAEGISMLSTGVNNSFLCNSITRNGGLGIDLKMTIPGVGVTANDDQDHDTGPNNRQNFPAIRWADSGSLNIGAALNSTPNTTFLIQFFSNTACDDSNHGEGQDYLGSTQVTTGPDGNVDFVLMSPEPFADGEYLTATATDAQGSTSEFSECLLVSSATAVVETIPVRPDLYQAVPNPFNPSTTIRYDVPGPGAAVKIVVYDVTGRHVATLVDGQQTAGTKQVSWDGRNDWGDAAATGIYFYRMTTGEFSQTRKMVLLK